MCLLIGLGRQCESGLRLFENDSEFSLFYKDGDENWRRVGDVPWKYVLYLVIVKHIHDIFNIY